MTEETYLITQGEIAAMDGPKKAHSQNPNAYRTNKSLGDATGLTGIGFHVVEVEPGFETTEHHCHHHEDECVFVLSGTATAFIGEEALEIGVGDFLGYRKGGLPHSIKNTGDVTFRCIVVGQRLDHDVADYTRLNKRIFRNAGLPWTLVEHADMEFLGAHVGKK